MIMIMSLHPAFYLDIQPATKIAAPLPPHTMIKYVAADLLPTTITAYNDLVQLPTITAYNEHVASDHLPGVGKHHQKGC